MAAELKDTNNTTAMVVDDNSLWYETVQTEFKSFRRLHQKLREQKAALQHQIDDIDRKKERMKASIEEVNECYKLAKSVLKYRQPTHQIFVRSVTAKTITLDVAMTDSIPIIKWLIYDREKLLGLHQQNIWYAGRLLNDEETLEEQGVCPESTLRLTLKS